MSERIRPHGDGDRGRDRESIAPMGTAAKPSGAHRPVLRAFARCRAVLYCQLQSLALASLVTGIADSSTISPRQLWFTGPLAQKPEQNRKT